MRNYRKKVLFDHEAISSRVEELAAEISARHPEGEILLIGILKGAFMFMADLVRRLSVPCEVDFVKISSYGSGTVSSGKLNILLDTSIPVEGRAVILVDDIVDSGLTLNEYRQALEARSPRSIETIALIDKTGRREKHVHLDYCGFRIEEGFVVGYGLDCNEFGRQTGDIYVLEDIGS